MLSCQGTGSRMTDSCSPKAPLVWSGWQHLVQDVPSMGCSSLSAVRVPRVPQNQIFLKPLTAIPDAKGFGRVAMNPHQGVMSASVGLTVAPGDESHPQGMFGTKLTCPFAPSAVSQFPPAVVKGHSGLPTCPISHIPVPCFTF